MASQDKRGYIRSDGIKRRSVVSSFIFKADLDSGRPRVALFKRSNKVSTYIYHHAPISGSIEKSDPSPLAAAWRELQEETTLTPENLGFLRHGKPYTFTDLSIGREWTIFPFMFRLRSASDEAKIKIDWEHESWAWFDPHTVEDTEAFGGVPRLAESLRRVWFEKDLGDEAGKVLADGLEKLAGDYVSGARQLAGDALQILRDVIAAFGSDHPDVLPASERWCKIMRLAAWHIWKNGRESMGAAIMNVLLSALSEIEHAMQSKQAATETTTWLSSVITKLDQRIASRQGSVEFLSQAFVTYLYNTFASKLTAGDPLSILTLSEPSTITHALRYLISKSNFTLDLRVLESRPLYEGVSLAASVAKDLSLLPPSETEPNNTITLYTDASAALASHNVDIVLLGADRIAASGAVSNKTGSLPAILSARYVTSSSPARIIVLGESEKVAPPGRPQDHVVEDINPHQVSQAWGADSNGSRVRDGASSLQSLILEKHSGSGKKKVEVTVRNVSFEWCPPDLIDVYIRESGEWTVDDIAGYSKRLAEEGERLFGGL
ncbi:hypothetical protein B0T17DRAFT_589118 [Bombardia bombarda]|uniref:Nudix hydrolase domain-containing protein n=1 Tax=Bombardia bombarda TaxID=252184 RepID=A0AA39X8G3_9PEZI|nr:hypothetical protein B0T17DRAFT_589118 [Bombardia bombarda]